MWLQFCYICGDNFVISDKDHFFLANIELIVISISWFHLTISSLHSLNFLLKQFTFLFHRYARQYWKCTFYSCSHPLFIILVTLFIPLIIFLFFLVTFFAFSHLFILLVTFYISLFFQSPFSFFQSPFLFVLVTLIKSNDFYTLWYKKRRKKDLQVSFLLWHSGHEEASKPQLTVLDEAIHHPKAIEWIRLTITLPLHELVISRSFAQEGVSISLQLITNIKRKILPTAKLSMYIIINL